MNGLVFLHESQRVHGDLNPVGSTHTAFALADLTSPKMNTLVDDSGKALIADFGFARIVDQFGFTTYNRSQDDMYGPPERAYYTGAGSPVKPTTEEDVWCFGMTALKVCSHLVRRQYFEPDILLDNDGQRSVWSEHDC